MPSSGTGIPIPIITLQRGGAGHVPSAVGFRAVTVTGHSACSLEPEDRAIGPKGAKPLSTPAAIIEIRSGNLGTVGIGCDVAVPWHGVWTQSNCEDVVSAQRQVVAA